MKKSPNILAFFLSIIVLIGSAWAFVNRQDIYDWLVLRNYTPDPRIAQIVASTTMDDETRKVFYVNRPSLQNKEAFRASCQATEQSIVLGCYVNTEGIYLLDVTDPRLSGVIEVTSAHEVLHAIYDRMSDDERRDVDRMTADFFATITNERIKKVVENYRAKDKNIVPNELHSILASEVRDLSPELETYYGQYFTDRKAIVAFSEKYEQQFTDLQNQVAAYDVQLEKLKLVIDQNQQLLPAKEADINSEKTRLDRLLAQGKTEEYNAAVPGFNAQVNSYNAVINRTKISIDQYNALVEKRNALATVEEELVKAIDANALPKAQ